MNDYWRGIFGWSTSRQRIWDQCKLRYYYRYIGKWEGPKGSIEKAKIQWLSNKKNWFMVKGGLIHEAIESQVNQWAVGRPTSKDAAKSLYSSKLEEIRRRPADHLVDETNGFPVSVDKYDLALDDGIKILDTFFDIIWANYRTLQYLDHEKFDYFLINNIKVTTKVDLVTRMPNKTIVVTDWKSGRPGERTEEDEDQLTVYALWAMTKYGIGSDAVRAEIRYIQDPMQRPTLVKVDEMEIAPLKDYITEQATAMLSVGSSSDFPPNPSDKACIECPFATICIQGHQHIPMELRANPIPPVS